jgi:DNA-directed RNA polymerase subunit RPC12/RpoP
MAGIGVVVVLLIVFGYGITLVANTLSEERRRNGEPSSRRPLAPERPTPRVVYDCPRCGSGVVFMIGGDLGMLQAATGMYTACMNCGAAVGPTRLVAG